jgi:hemerythrin
VQNGLPPLGRARDWRGAKRPGAACEANAKGGTPEKPGFFCGAPQKKCAQILLFTHQTSLLTPPPPYTCHYPQACAIIGYAVWIKEPVFMSTEKNFVVWSDAYSVGSALIDSQHKELAAMTNELFRSCEQPEGRMASFLKTIHRAVNYAKTHFATEEIFMRKVSYPDYIAHKKEHEDFVNEVLRQVKNFEAGTCTPLDFAMFLKTWLLNHIAVSDKKYAPFLAGVRDEDFRPQ